MNHSQEQIPDNTSFETVRRQAVQLHNQQNYEEALTLRVGLFNQLESGSNARGIMARDISSDYDRLGKPQEAESMARKAYGIHDSIILDREDFDKPGAGEYRERAVSAMYVGAILARKSLHLGGAYDSIVSQQALAFTARARQDLEKARELGNNTQSIDQYEINFLRRESIIQSLFGDYTIGVTAAQQAIKYAFLSESSKAENNDSTIGLEQRLKAKLKALAGGIGALLVSSVTEYEPTKRRNLAIKLADKLL